jgi:hypothetical protein
MFNVKRHGMTILLGGGYTATEGREGNLPTLRIRKNGKEVSFFKGSSLCFGKALTAEDKRYLLSLAGLKEVL